MRKTNNSSSSWNYNKTLLGNAHEYQHVNSKYELKIKDIPIKEAQRATLRRFADKCGPINNQSMILLDDAALSEANSHISAGYNFKIIDVVECDRATTVAQEKNKKGHTNIKVTHSDLIDVVKNLFLMNCLSLDFLGSFGMKAKNTGKRICDILQLVLQNNQLFRYAFRINVSLDTRVNGETYDEVSAAIEQYLSISGWDWKTDIDSRRLVAIAAKVPGVSYVVSAACTLPTAVPALATASSGNITILEKGAIPLGNCTTIAT